MAHRHSGHETRWPKDRGQITIFVVLAMSLFLIGFVGFAVDMTNLWFHRQMAQGAADSACQAGIMDVLFRAQGVPLSSPGMFPLSSFDCFGATTYSPCQYASFNGYPATTAGRVKVSFPSSLSPAPPITIPPSSMAPVPFIRVDIVDPVRMYFAPLITRNSSQDVHATAICGIDLAEVPIPIIILDPTRACSFDISGTGNQPKLAVLGGPAQSVQVNSNNATAVCQNGNPIVSLAQGGPNFTGSDFGVFGGPTTVPFVFQPGTTPGNYISPHSPIADPFALLPAPPNPGGVPAMGVNGTPVLHNINGCPNPVGCLRFSGGRYPTGITVGQGPPSQRTAIFDPGVYYLEGRLNLASNSTVRPSTGAVGDGSGGTMFYFATANSVTVDANSGKALGLDPFLTSRAPCPGGLPLNPALGVPATLQGNILLAPCTGTYGQIDVDPNTGATAPARGMLFFQNRATNGAGDWGGGGEFLLAGTIYFHQCNASGTGVGCSPPPTAYNASFKLQGNSCSATYIIGNIDTDKLIMGGTPCIKMSLDPYAVQRVLKATLIR